MVSFRAFWVAISYRLAPCFPESEVCVEMKFIGDRSSILGTIIPSGKLRAKMTKMRPKLRENCVVGFFLHFLYLFS